MTGRVDVASEFGPVVLLWNRDSEGPLVRRILMSKPDKPADVVADSLFPHAVFSRCSETDFVAERLLEVIGGQGRPFPVDLLDLSSCTSFQLSVLLEDSKIVSGSVSSYGRLAKAISRPQGARAVGNALAWNPFPFLIPCHRVVSADGSIGGFQGGVSMKQMLLEREGVSFSKSGRIISPNWYPSEQ